MKRHSAVGDRDGASVLVREVGADGKVYSYVEGGRQLVRSAERRARQPSALSALLRAAFLPVGYPHTVAPEYAAFQWCDTAQAACSYLRNILTTSALLRGAGVGEGAASPMAAAVAWVLRDGLGMAGSLLFSVAVGAGFDDNVKEWRLFADLINDVGLTLDMLAPLAGRGAAFTLVAAAGAACKTTCGMVAGATRASITAHFARASNLSDVSAKENAQETAVTLLGLVVGTLFASQLGEADSLATWLAFAALTALHVYFNWVGVGCLTFSWLNRQRADFVTREWVVHGRVPSPAEVAGRERLWGPLWIWLAGPSMGAPLRNAGIQDAAHLKKLVGLYSSQRYLLTAREAGRLRRWLLGSRHISISIVLRDDAGPDDALHALLQAAVLTHGEGGRRDRGQRAGGERGGGAGGGGGEGGGGVSTGSDEQKKGIALPGRDQHEEILGDDSGYYPRYSVDESAGAAETSLAASLHATSCAWPAFRAAMLAAGWNTNALRVSNGCRCAWADIDLVSDALNPQDTTFSTTGLRGAAPLQPNRNKDA